MEPNAQPDHTTAQPLRQNGEERGRRFWPLAVATLLLAFVLAALFGERGIMREVQYRRTLAALDAELEQIAAANGELRSEIGALRNNAKYVEAIARRELGMVRPDEIIYQFPASGEKTETVRRPEVPH